MYIYIYIIQYDQCIIIQLIYNINNINNINITIPISKYYYNVI